MNKSSPSCCRQSVELGYSFVDLLSMFKYRVRVTAVSSSYVASALILWIAAHFYDLITCSLINLIYIFTFLNHNIS